jgi:putative oxidoreductase
MLTVLPLLGRVLLAAVFLFSAVGKIMDPSGTRAMMESFGMPATGTLIVAAILVEVAGAVLLVVGRAARWGALLLALYLVPTTLIFHTAFWDRSQLAHFLKNLAIIGGLLQVIAFGAARPAGQRP